MTADNRPGRLRPALLTVLVSAGLLAGCADSKQIMESADVFNLFTEPEKRLPGERRPALPTSDTVEVNETAAATPVSVPAASGGGDWTQPGGTPANAPGHVALSGGGGGAAWSQSVARIQKNERLTAPPIVYNGTVYVIDNQANVAAYSLGGGGRAWAVPLRPEEQRGTGFGGGLAADNGLVVAATPYGKLHGLDASTGGQAWEFDMEAPARSAPTISGGRAFVVSSDNVLHAINMSDGTEAWNFIGSGADAGVLGNASPAVVGNTVIVPYQNGEIIAFDTASGETKWFDAVTGASRFTTVAALNDVVARPVVYDGVVYAVGVSGRIIAIQASTGERLWAQNVGSSHTPAVAGNTIFVANLSGEVVALDRSTGNVRWRSGLEGANISLAGPLLAGGRLWLGTSDGRIVTMDPSNGQVLSAEQIGNPVYIGPIAAGGRVFVLDNGGKLTAIN